ncbi:hypothetical protein THAOC_05085, partial [Thalassiosira oceanica]
TPPTGPRVTTRSSARKSAAAAAKNDAAESLSSFSRQLEEAAAAGDGGTMRTRRRSYVRPNPPERKRARTVAAATVEGAKKARTDAEAPTVQTVDLTGESQASEAGTNAAADEGASRTAQAADLTGGDRNGPRWDFLGGVQARGRGAEGEEVVHAHRSGDRTEVLLRQGGDRDLEKAQGARARRDDRGALAGLCRGGEAGRGAEADSSPPGTSAPLRVEFDSGLHERMREEATKSLEGNPDATDHDRERAACGMKLGVAGPVHKPDGRRQTFALLAEAGGTGTDVRSARRREILLEQIIQFNKRAVGDNNHCYSDTKIEFGNHVQKFGVILVPTKKRKRPGEGEGEEEDEDGRRARKAKEDNDAFRAYNKHTKCLDRFLECWASWIGGTVREAARMVCHGLARLYPEEYLGEVATADKYKPSVYEPDEPPPGYVCHDGSSPEVKANVQWNLLYSELLRWREEHGNVLVPVKRGDLGRWVARMRSGKDRLSETRLRLVRGSFFDCDRAQWRVGKSLTTLFAHATHVCPLQLNDVGFKWTGEFGKNLPVPGGDPRFNRMVAAKVTFPELTFRECMYLGGYEDEELDTVKNQKFTWRTIYVVLKDQLREIVGKFDSRVNKNKAHLNREALVGTLRSDDPDRLTKVFGERAGLFEGFMEKAAERKREGINPDDHRALRRRKGDGRKQEGCEREGAQDEHDMAMEEDEEASDMEAHNEYEQEEPDQEALGMDERHQQHLGNWQPDYPNYQYDDL